MAGRERESKEGKEREREGRGVEEVKKVFITFRIRMEANNSNQLK